MLKEPFTLPCQLVISGTKLSHIFGDDDVAVFTPLGLSDKNIARSQINILCAETQRFIWTHTAAKL